MRRNTLREFDETENNEEGLSIDNADYHRIICSLVEDLDPRIIDMILKAFPDITTYVAYVEELHQENIYIVGRIYEHLAGKVYWRVQEAVMLKYGLIDGIPKTLAEVAEIMGYPEEVIRNRIKWCLSPLFQKIHHERARREFFKEMCQEERPSNDCSDQS